MWGEIQAGSHKHASRRWPCKGNVRHRVKLGMYYMDPQTSPSGEGVFEEDKSDRPHTGERINSGLYKITTVELQWLEKAWYHKK